MELSYWTDLLRPMFVGKKVIVAGQWAAATTQTVRDILSLGAVEVLVVATNGMGLGPSPVEAGAKLIALNVIPADSSMIAGIRSCQDTIRNLPDSVCAQIDAFDPDRTAVAVGDFLTETPTIAGRGFLFHRRPEWVGLDDKTCIDALWARAGIEQAPSVVVDATDGAVAKAFPAFDCGDGIVVAVDAAEGWTGGGEGTRWIRRPDHISAALDGWHGRRVRVMPFLEGIPCSVHGIVFADTVVALRPVEMIVLRRADDSLFYAGCSSYFDPPAADRAAMRRAAQQVGVQLRADVGYRGAFTLDGVLTYQGFRPTEVNPRNGAGFVTMARQYPEHPLLLLVDCIASGVNLEWRADALERELLLAFDTKRGGGTWRSFPGRSALSTDVSNLVFTPDGARPAVGAETPDVTFTVGAAPDAFVRAAWERDRTPVGASLAPRAVAFWQWADAALDLGIGPLTSAQSRRS
jgi:hypothetical protein